jgi:hypothetical protein
LQTRKAIATTRPPIAVSGRSFCVCHSPYAQWRSAVGDLPRRWANQFDQIAPIYPAHPALNGAKSLAPKSQFREQIQPDRGCKCRPKKYFFPEIRK